MMTFVPSPDAPMAGWFCTPSPALEGTEVPERSTGPLLRLGASYSPGAIVGTVSLEKSVEAGSWAPSHTGPVVGLRARRAR